MVVFAPQFIPIDVNVRLVSEEDIVIDVIYIHLLIFFNSFNAYFLFVAVCKGGCRNEGKCIAPNQCQCPKGYEGKNCKKGAYDYLIIVTHDFRSLTMPHFIKKFQ